MSIEFSKEVMTADNHFAQYYQSESAVIAKVTLIDSDQIEYNGGDSVSVFVSCYRHEWLEEAQFNKSEFRLKWRTGFVDLEAENLEELEELLKRIDIESIVRANSETIHTPLY